ncbi:MAG: PD-(D/E)XK nuclease family protein [Verrucomicrobiae bacterium]|nr:PD-(D/E)XK nuclease family protein [Verrucomicrobiae bacterium]
MTPQLITAPTFPQLEVELIQDLLTAAATAPLTPKWIVTPNASLAKHLRARLLHTTGFKVALNTEIVSLTALSRKLAHHLLHKTPQDHDAELLLALTQILRELPADSPLAVLATIPNGARILLPVIRDLLDSGLCYRDLADNLVNEITQNPGLKKIRGFPALMLDIQCRFLGQHHIPMAALVFTELASAIEQAVENDLYRALGAENTDQRPKLWIYGFYEWLDVHLQWLTALAQRLPLKFFYPAIDGRPGARDHPAFAFSIPILQHLQARIPSLEHRHISLAGSHPTESPAQFFAATFPEGELPDTPPPFLTWQTAAGPRAEVIAAAVQIRRWLEDARDPVAPRDILVVAMQAEPYVPLMREVFRDFAIPLQISDVPVGVGPDSEPLRFVIQLWREQAAPDWLFGYLRQYPDLPAARGVALDDFEKKIRDLNLPGGPAWHRLATLAANLPADGPIRFTNSEQQLIRHILMFVPDDVAAPLTVADMSAKLAALSTIWLPDPQPLTLARQILERCCALFPQLSLTRDEWAGWLETTIPTPISSEPPTDAVWFLPLMRARGVTARRLVWLGLANGKFPPPYPDDPVLSEPMSHALAKLLRDIGHWFPQKNRLTEEMQLLFWLVNTAAERIHWIIPTADFDGRALAPTPWVERYRQRWEKSGSMHRPPAIPRSPRLQALTLHQLDPHTGRFVPPSLAPFLSDSLAQAVSELWQQTSPQFVPAILTLPADYPAICLTGWPREWKTSLAVTDLEDLARCPLRFYAQRVMEWEPIEPIRLTRSLDHLTRGTLLHELLARMVATFPTGSRVDEIARFWQSAPSSAWDQLWNQTLAAHADIQLQFQLLPAVFQSAARAELEELARRYWNWVADQPGMLQRETHLAEQTFKHDFPDLSDWQICGKIDRIDRDNEARLFLYDFKSGRKPDSPSKLIRLGWLIQALIYPWLVDEQTTSEFQFIFLGNDPPKTAQSGEDDPKLFLRSVAGFLEHRYFPPLPREVLADLMDETSLNPCSHCNAISICRRFEPGLIQLAERQWLENDIARPRTQEVERILINDSKKKKRS